MSPCKISTRKLLLVAGIVWLLVGVNITQIGIGTYQVQGSGILWMLFLASAVVFALFHLFVFTKMVAKHTERINSYTEDTTSIWCFFDKKGYIIMAFMMVGGISLRLLGILPEWFIAFFYTGLGLALIVAGITFLVNYFRKPQLHDVSLADGHGE